MSDEGLTKFIEHSGPAIHQGATVDGGLDAARTAVKEPQSKHVFNRGSSNSNS